MSNVNLLKNLPTGGDIKSLARIFPNTDLSAVATFFALLGVSGEILTEVKAHMAKRKISLGRWRILAQLIRHSEQCLTPRDLAARIGVTRATITGLVDALEQCGYVRREYSKRDRRSIHVHLLPAGRRFVKATMPGRLGQIARIMAHLSAQERKSLQSLLLKVRQGLADEG